VNNIVNRICLQRLVSVVKFIAERLAFRADENVESPRTFFQKIFKTSFKEMTRFLSSEDAMLLVTGFATVSQIANHSQIPCCIIMLCYSWVKKCNVTILRHKYQWYVEILVTSWIIPYPNILYPHMGSPTTPGPQAPTIWIRRWQKYKYSWGTSHRLWKNFKITHDSKISCNSLEGFPTLLLRKSNIQNFSVLDTITNGLQQNSILSRLKNLLKVCLHHLTATVS